MTSRYCFCLFLFLFYFDMNLSNNSLSNIKINNLSIMLVIHRPLKLLIMHVNIILQKVLLICEHVSDIPGMTHKTRSHAGETECMMCFLIIHYTVYRKIKVSFLFICLLTLPKSIRVRTECCTHNNSFLLAL